MKYIKEELENLIIFENLSYEEIGRRYNVSGTYIKKIAGKLGISLKKRANFPEGWKPSNYNTGKEIICINCGEKCDIYSKKYCSTRCQQEYQSNEKYKDFLLNNEKYCRENYDPGHFKWRFLEEQDHKCDICKIEPIWNDTQLVFVMDHIDGDASNNKRDNLRLVCPNCDSQLPTFKSRNKNSARKTRYINQRKNL